MVKDKVLIGVIIGLLADGVKLTVNYIMYLLNFTDVVFWQITATRFLEKKDLFTPFAYVIGGIADITVTGALGVMFIYMLSFIGKENLWLKGIGFGMLVWVGLFGTLLGISVQNKIPQDPSGIMVTIIAHLVFGLGLAGFTRLIYNVSKEDLKEVKEVVSRISPVPAQKVPISKSEKEITLTREVNLKKPSKLEKLKRLIKRK